MDRAVAAHGHDPSDAVTGGPRRELGPVAWGLRPDDVHGPALAPELARHGVERPSASATARGGVEDDLGVDQTAAR